MRPSKDLYLKLKKHKLNFFVSVPCKLLKDLIILLENDPEIIHTPITREEEGIGIIAGAHMAGKRAAIIMQNSGIGNSINAICSLLNYYQLPVVFIISHRGTQGETIEVQNQMGNATEALLNAANIRSYQISTPDELHSLDVGMIEAYKSSKSVAFLFPFSFWKKT